MNGIALNEMCVSKHEVFQFVNHMHTQKRRMPAFTKQKLNCSSLPMQPPWIKNEIQNLPI